MLKRIEGRDPKRIVEEGYNCIFEQHSQWANSVRVAERAKYTKVLCEQLPPGTEVLELGCGVGVPTTQELAECFSVTGVDISAQQIAVARQNVPTAKFIHADMTKLDFAPASFDGVAAFYSLIHIPRQEQPALVQSIASWLRPGGLMVATMGANSIEAGFNDDWLGAPMYWSSFDSRTNRQIIEDAGLHILSAREETADEFGTPVTFLWIVARKPNPSETNQPERGY
jgi:SAM-dependent methyltransferase